MGLSGFIVLGVVVAGIGFLVLYIHMGMKDFHKVTQ